MAEGPAVRSDKTAIALIVLALFIAGFVGYMVAQPGKPVYANKTYTTIETTMWWTWSLTTFTDKVFIPVCFHELKHENQTLGWMRVACPPDIEEEFRRL
ncbi:MAG: hypothetical protein QXF97_06555, partial [Candidatus Caldarchaeum sp.]